MISRISYFVINSPNYIETARHGNFYSGSISALFQQLRHYYTCYFKTGDTKSVFGAVTLWPHVHKCWCRTKLCSAGAHTFCPTLSYWEPQGTFLMLVQVLSLFLCCQDGYMTRASGGKNENVPFCNTHSSTFSSSLSLLCGKSSSTQTRKGMNAIIRRTLSIRNASQCASQAILLQVQAFFYCKDAGGVNKQRLQILDWWC